MLLNWGVNGGGCVLSLLWWCLRFIVFASRFAVQKSQLWPPYIARGLPLGGFWLGSSFSGGMEASEDSVVGEMLCVEGVWCAELDVAGVTVGPVGLASAGRKGDSGRRVWKLASDLRGEALRRGRELFESKLPCEMP